MPFQYGTSADSPTRQILNKVPEVTIFFWIIKILATTVGETGADFLNSNLGLGMTKTSFIMAGLLCLALVFQFRCKKYVPAVYWVAVVLISVVGTLLTDNLVEHLGMTLPIATILFASLLAVTFATWYAVEKTLSIHSIHSMRREAFYWLAILFTFALGTAGGDLTAEGLHLGYWISALLFAGLIAATTFAYSIFELMQRGQCCGPGQASGQVLTDRAAILSALD